MKACWSDQRPVAKEAWYKPIANKYEPDMDRWTRNHDSDMDLWASILTPIKQCVARNREPEPAIDRGWTITPSIATECI